jgi:RNA polymerase sigma-70 factor (ECF subfamily)
VDDIAQEAFLTAWRHRDAYDRDRDFGKWLRGIARNLVANERRKSARHARILSTRMTDILERTTGQEAAVNEESMRAQLRLMRECLDQVPENTRSILIRRYRDEETAVSMAARLGATATAIRQILCRVRKAVRECMQKKLGALET